MFILFSVKVLSSVSFALNLPHTNHLTFWHSVSISHGQIVDCKKKQLNIFLMSHSEGYCKENTVVVF